MKILELMSKIQEEGNDRTFSYRGYNCKIERKGEYGHLCGYIEIPIGHNLHGKTYGEIEEIYEYELPTHGGLTYSGYQSGVYYIGFDCAHCGDYTISSILFSKMEQELKGERNINNIEVEGTYRDMEYVEETLEKMVDYIENSTNKRLVMESL